MNNISNVKIQTNEIINLPNLDAGVDLLLQKIALTDFQKLQIVWNPSEANVNLQITGTWSIKGTARSFAEERAAQIATRLTDKIVEESRKRFTTLESVVDFIHENKKSIKESYSLSLSADVVLSHYLEIANLKNVKDTPQAEINKAFFAKQFPMVRACTSSRTIEKANQLYKKFHSKIYTDLNCEELQKTLASNRDLNDMEYKKLFFLYSFTDDPVGHEVIEPMQIPPANGYNKNNAVDEEKPLPNAPLNEQVLRRGDCESFMKAMWKGFYKGQYFYQSSGYPSLKLQVFHQLLSRMPEDLQNMCLQSLLNTSDMEEIKLFLSLMIKANDRVSYRKNERPLDLNNVLRHIPAKVFLSTILRDPTMLEPGMGYEKLAAKLLVESVKAKDLAGIDQASRLLKSFERYDYVDRVPMGTLNVFQGAKSFLNAGDLEIFIENYIPYFPMDDQLEQKVDYALKRKKFKEKYVRNLTPDADGWRRYTLEEIDDAFRASLNPKPIAACSTDRGQEELEARLLKVSLPDAPKAACSTDRGLDELEARLLKVSLPDAPKSVLENAIEV